MLKLTKTLFLPNCQVSNVFFFKSYHSRIEFFQPCSASQTTLTRFWLFDHLPTYVDNFYGINVDKKWTFLDHLPTSSCKRSLWTTPYCVTFSGVRFFWGNKRKYFTDIPIAAFGFNGICLSQVCTLNLQFLPTFIFWHLGLKIVFLNLQLCK